MFEQVVVKFSQINDSVTVKVNGTEVFNHALLVHNQPHVSYDMTGDLQPGENTIEVIGISKIGMAVLYGSLSSNGKIIDDWAVGYGGTHAYDVNKPFVHETIKIDYQDNATGAHIDLSSCSDDAMLHIDQIDGEATITLNNQPFHQGTQPIQLHFMSDNLQEENILHVQVTSDSGGSGRLQAKIFIDSNEAHAWNIGDAGVGSNTIFLDETFTFIYQTW